MTAAVPTPRHGPLHLLALALLYLGLMAAVLWSAGLMTATGGDGSDGRADTSVSCRTAGGAGLQ